MSRHATRMILFRSLVDDEFLNQFLTDPEGALAEYDLSEEDKLNLIERGQELLALVQAQDPGDVNVAGKPIKWKPFWLFPIIFAEPPPDLPAEDWAEFVALRDEWEPLVARIREASEPERLQLIEGLITSMEDHIKSEQPTGGTEDPV